MVDNIFYEQFNRVFNKDFSIKICGRNETIKLIDICRNIDPSRNFGDINTGFMNKDSIIDLYKSSLVKG